MARHARDRDEGLDRASRQAALLSGAQAAQERSAGAGAGRERETFAQFVRRNATYILSVAAVVALAVFMLVVLRGGDSQEAGAGAGTQDGAADASPYDWSNLEFADGRCSYVVDGQVKSRLGIDVSENQHAVDWDAVAADGIEFAIIRLGYRGATEGDLYVDEYFQANLAGAKAAGVPCGVYFFSQAQTVEEAVEEADFVLEQLDGATLEYPIAFDSEESVLGLEETRVSGLDKTDMTLIAQAFCARVEAAGHRSLIYGNGSDLSRMHDDSLQDSSLWWAEYEVAAPSTDAGIALWQYATDGEVAGIEDAVDMNIDLTGVLG